MSETRESSGMQVIRPRRKVSGLDEGEVDGLCGA